MDPETEARNMDPRGDIFVELVLRARTMAAFELSRLVNSVAHGIGARRLDIFLVDYSQRELLSIDPDVDHADITIDGTIAGRAYVTGDVMRSHHDGEISVWVPLVDGTERLGVMQAVFGSEADVDARLEAFGGLISELIVSKGEYSDWFRRRRRRKDLNVSAELQWRQLPPLTFTRRTYAMAGALEPAYEMGGDAFDYGDNIDGLVFSITDAMGHGLEAMLLSVATHAALRNIRSHGQPIEMAYVTADELLRIQFGDSRYVTGIIGNFDSTTNVLSWINAGHPLPLLLRDRQIVGPLTCAPSLPMGLGGKVVEVAHTQLQPGDRVLFYTDGVTESRRRDEQFGADQLADHLQRATLDGMGPAETMRRLSLTVLSHHDFELGDDSSMLLLEVILDPPPADPTP